MLYLCVGGATLVNRLENDPRMFRLVYGGGKKNFRLRESRKEVLINSFVRALSSNLWHLRETLRKARCRSLGAEMKFRGFLVINKRSRLINCLREVARIELSWNLITAEFLEFSESSRMLKVFLKQLNCQFLRLALFGCVGFTENLDIQQKNLHLRIIQR